MDLDPGRILGLGQNLQQLGVGEEEESREALAFSLQIIVETLPEWIKFEFVGLFEWLCLVSSVSCSRGYHTDSSFAQNKSI